MIYYLILVISLLGYSLGGCIKETIHLFKTNGFYSDNYEKALDKMYLFGTCFIHVMYLLYLEILYFQLGHRDYI